MRAAERGPTGLGGWTKPPPCIPYTEHTSDERRDLWNTNKPQPGVGCDRRARAAYFIIARNSSNFITRIRYSPPLTPHSSPVVCTSRGFRASVFVVYVSVTPGDLGGTHMLCDSFRKQMDVFSLIINRLTGADAIRTLDTFSNESPSRSHPENHFLFRFEYTVIHALINN